MLNFVGEKWYFGKIYNDFIGRPLLRTGYYTTLNTLDKGFIEIFGPYGVLRGTRTLTSTLRGFQSGLIYDYAGKISLGVVLLVLPTSILSSLLLFI